MFNAHMCTIFKVIFCKLSPSSSPTQPRSHGANSLHTLLPSYAQLGSNQRYSAPFFLKLQSFKCWPDRFQSQGFKIAFQHIGSLSVNRRKGFSLLFPVSQHQRRCGTNNCFLSLSCCPALTELAPPAVELSQFW